MMKISQPSSLASVVGSREHTLSTSWGTSVQPLENLLVEFGEWLFLGGMEESDDY